MQHPPTRNVYTQYMVFDFSVNVAPTAVMALAAVKGSVSRRAHAVRDHRDIIFGFQIVSD